VTIWDPVTGAKIFQYSGAHGKLELTAACFDKSGRRLITGSRDGIVKMWNYNNGQILKKMMKTNDLEVSDILYVEMVRFFILICLGIEQIYRHCRLG
jgi:WD40 repeat protein